LSVVLPDTIDFEAYLAGPSEDAHIRSPAAYSEDVKAMFRDDQVGYGYMLPWARTVSTVRIRPSEVSVWAGVNGHGKTLLLLQVMLSLMRQNAKVCIASMEMPIKATLKRMVMQAAATTNPSDAYIDAFMKWLDGRLYLYDQLGTVESTRIIALARYAHRELGCDQMVIDSLLKCGIGVTDWDGQKRFVGELCAHAMGTTQHVHLVAHSRKMQDERQQIDKMAVKGAGDITDQVDNLFLVWRNKPKEEAKRMGKTDKDDQPDAALTCDKQRHGPPEGGEDRWGLWYDRRSNAFTESSKARAWPLELQMCESGEVPF
jgi:twinkle protein